MSDAPATTSQHPLEPIFHPGSIAIVGVPREVSAPGGGGGFLLALLEHGFHEEKPLYLVNPNTEEIRGLPCYPSLLETPGPVDHVISSVPARAVEGLIEQSIEKGVRSIHFYTAGFAEIGDPELARLQEQLMARAIDAGIRVIGPNCMGLYVPGERIAFQTRCPTEPGNVMAISQSGGNAMDIIFGLALRGVRFSKLVSFGNAADVAAPELFDYAAGDPETEVVISYLEGADGGRALFEALRRCARVKPTIILKGGLTDAGARAANSHTGSLAGSRDIFEAMCRQTGAIRAETMTELHDLLIGVTTNLRHVQGPRAMMVGGGGGFSVLAADAMANVGVDLPELAEETTAELRRLMPVAGNSVRNPIDASHFHSGDAREDSLREVLRVAAHAPGIDALFVTTGSAPSWVDPPAPGSRPDPELERRLEERRLLAEKQAMQDLIDMQTEAERPVIGVRRARGVERWLTDEVLALAYQHGLAVFPSVPRAARTVGRLLEWRARREGLPELF